MTITMKIMLSLLLLGAQFGCKEERYAGSNQQVLYDAWSTYFKVRIGEYPDSAKYVFVANVLKKRSMQQFENILRDDWISKVKELRYATLEDHEEAGCINSNDCKLESAEEAAWETLVFFFPAEEISKDGKSRKR